MRARARCFRSRTAARSPSSQRHALPAEAHRPRLAEVALFLRQRGSPDREDFERSVAAHRRKLEAELAAEAKAQFDLQRKAMNEALSAKEGALARFRSEELQLRRHLRELEEADKNRDVDYQRRLDEERRRI